MITVAFNSEATIQTTLDSVAAQSYPDLEYIVVDGGSSDGTLGIVQDYPELVTDVISEPDQGIYDAMNKGVQQSTGEIIGILNSDDFYLHNNVLNEVMGFFSDDPSLEVVLGDVDFVDENDLSRPIRSYSTGNFKPWMFRFGLMPPHPAVFIRKSTYDRVGLYKLDYKIASDFDFLTRLLLVNKSSYLCSNKTWVRMRTGGASTSGGQIHYSITREFKKSLEQNKIYTNYLMLLARLPYKYIKQVLFR